MKSLLFVISIILSTGLLQGQTITGKVLDAATNEALAYVNIGVVGQPRGTVTDEDGAFVLETAGLSIETTVRFSMIGFLAQTFTIKELSDNNGRIVKLENVPVQLSEVVVKPGTLRKVGITKSASRQVCGWGGTFFGKGYEIGAKIELGEAPVTIESLHILVHKQSFDTCLLRLHIRNIIDDLPGDELLTKDILFTITKESGWEEIDLSKYGLRFQGNIILSVEWVAVIGVNKDKFVKVSTQEGKKPIILFKTNKNQCCIYTRWGSEALWKQGEGEGRAPCFYLTVR